MWPAIVLSASVTKGTVADIRMLDALLDGVDDSIVIGDVCLDPGYLSRYAVQSISDHGGLPVIKLKCNTTARAAAVPYKRRYSRRSVVEGIIAAIKMRFGEMIYSRKTRNQHVELMLSQADRVGRDGSDEDTVICGHTQ